MNNKLNKLKYLVYSIWFCFHYLPWKQAIKLPVLFASKPILLKLKGKIIINGTISRGMILFGVHSDPAYEQISNRFIWSNEGECVFNGQCFIKSGGAIIIKKDATLNMGNHLSIGPLCRITCTNHITIGDNVSFGMEITVMDTDFHHTYNLEKRKVSTVTRPIRISQNCWIGFRCLILKGTELPPYTIVGAYSVCNKKMDIPSFSLIAGTPVVIKVQNIARLLDDNISDIEIEGIIKQKEEYGQVSN